MFVVVPKTFGTVIFHEVLILIFCPVGFVALVVLVALLMCFSFCGLAFVSWLLWPVVLWSMGGL